MIQFQFYIIMKRHLILVCMLTYLSVIAFLCDGSIWIHFNFNPSFLTKHGLTDEY